VHKERLSVLFGRQLEVNRAAGGAAWFDFGQLCNQPLGAADYMAISHTYHTVFLSGRCSALVWSLVSVTTR
jgi:predicted ATPase